MANYQPIESDERLENDNNLEFKSFLGNEDTTTDTSGGRGYRRDQPARLSFWNIEYYQPWFDVDPQTVLRRCYYTMVPTEKDYLTNHLSPNPDLYGPFWTLSTLAFSLFVFSSLASSITSYLSDIPFNYDFKLLSIAVSLVYSYGLGLPAILWLVLRYLGVSEWSLVEAFAIYGYGQFIWIPVSILCIIPVPILRWALCSVAFGLSGYFLVSNVYPILATAEAKATRLLVIVLFLLHAALAFTFKLQFFSYYVVEPIGGADPIGMEPVVPTASATVSATSNPPSF
ncbi:Yip1-domain-containing protein [Serendipita vermifera]|nr:Yip1-domain-containing protein [Serendipita vermifera]